MKPEDIKKIKERIELTLSKRSGIGAVNHFTGESYKIPDIKNGELTAKIGENTIDLLLKIIGNDRDRDVFPELGTGTYSGGAIPQAFNVNDINRICDELDKDIDDPNRGGYKGYYNGVYYDLPGGIGSDPGSENKTETNHCGSSCTGICVGSCIGMCNGCIGCSSCAASCKSSSDAEVKNINRPIT